MNRGLIYTGYTAPNYTRNAEDDDFDGPTLDSKWIKTGTATVESYNDKVKSALYFQHAASSSNITIHQTYANTGNFSITACVGFHGDTNFHYVAPFVNDATDANDIQAQALYNTSGAGNFAFRRAHIISTTFGAGSDTTVTHVRYPLIFLHIQRSTNNWLCYYSNNGVYWQLVAGGAVSIPMTVAKIGLVCGVSGAATKSRTVLHWFRRDWITL